MCLRVRIPATYNEYKLFAHGNLLVQANEIDSMNLHIISQTTIEIQKTRHVRLATRAAHEPKQDAKP